ncbi:MAG: hypothetical protein K8F92_01525 [Hyphomicrobium sp.]|nr:MAG: hypothetical protein F9K20_16355 [Hyphomicrobium sp.]MBZ0208321.1 hypothetical protein [Hyphomicrobium sp.]
MIVNFVAVLAATISANVAPPDIDLWVGLRQVVSIGDLNSDSFALERIQEARSRVVVLFRPNGESCTFRFPLPIGRSVQLRAHGPSRQSLLCALTLRELGDTTTARFEMECIEQPHSERPRCPG